MDAFNPPSERPAILRSILAAHSGNAGGRQCARFLDALERLGSVTTAELSRFLDVYDPPARKRDLMRRGHTIMMSWDTDQTECGEMHRVGRYALVQGAQACLF
jgi:hypothetical protein